MKSFADYKIYNNLIFLLPIFVGVYIDVALFTLLAVIIFFTSANYHWTLVKHPRHHGKARVIDIVAAFACYVYLSYFILYHQEPALQLPLFIGLAGTLGVFFIGKYRKSEGIHAIFHASIAIMAALIGLL